MIFFFNAVLIVTAPLILNFSFGLRDGCYMVVVGSWRDVCFKELFQIADSDWRTGRCFVLNVVFHYHHEMCTNIGE